MWPQNPSLPRATPSPGEWAAPGDLALRSRTQQREGTSQPCRSYRPGTSVLFPRPLLYSLLLALMKPAARVSAALRRGPRDRHCGRPPAHSQGGPGALSPTAMGTPPHQQSHQGLGSRPFPLPRELPADPDETLIQAERP